MKKKLLLLILTMLPLVASADAVEIDGIYYNLISENNTAEVTRNPNYTGSIVIPETVSYDNVTYSVTSIGERAFYGCSGLTSVTIPNSVTSIGGWAFCDCSGLTSVNISDVAAWCVINFANYYSNPLYYAHHLFINGEEIKDLVIPNSVTSIGDWAFYRCSSLTSVTIPNSVTSIGNSAFSGCSGLTSITIGSGVTSIGSSAFENCSYLQTIYCLNPIPPTCTSVSTFTTTNARDKFDIYNYSILHVPMGSGEVYSSAYEWRYFNKIKEDMEADGNIYYANLTVKQGTTGYTRQALKAAETYTIYIGSLGENKVNSVTFNGTDVTEQVVNGYYTTPEIKGESILSISYEVGSAINSMSLSQVKVTGNDGEICVSQIEDPADVSVYSVDGKLVGTIPSALGNVRIQAAREQVYIVKVGARTYKIAL